MPDIAARGGRLRLAELAAGIRHLRDEPALRGPFPAIVIAAAGIGMAEVIPFAVVTDGLDRDSAFLGRAVRLPRRRRDRRPAWRSRA